MHYARVKKYGTTEGRVKPTPEERFWSKVDKNGPVPAHAPQLGKCWVWDGCRHHHGHPPFKVDGKPTMAYRFSYELVYGNKADGWYLDHLCKVPWCVNPSHLEPVTNGENILRGDGPGAINARKTHCKNGHELQPLKSDPKRRGCKICAADNQRERRRRAREAGA